jgi:hypothetical protein
VSRETISRGARLPVPGYADERPQTALMPSRAEIVSFDDSPPPTGANPWVVAGTGPGTRIEVTDPDPGWPRQYDSLADRIREALGWRVLQLEHVGSTAVPGLAASPSSTST